MTVSSPNDNNIIFGHELRKLRIYANKFHNMKKSFLILILLSVTILFAKAETFEVFTNDGKSFTGYLVSKSDTTITIHNMYTFRDMTFSASEIKSAESHEGGKITVENGKLVGFTYAEMYEQRKRQEDQRLGDPNYAIGKALKTSGAIGLGIGVPSLTLGIILVASGQAGQNAISEKLKKATDLNEIAKLTAQAQDYSNCTTAGCVFLPLGGALTIIGAPLYAHGKRILDLNLQVSENGAGVAVKF